MNYREKILELARSGPLLPSSVARQLGLSLVLASALLSELVERKELAVSALKVGSSPLYYLPDQRAGLLRWAGYLNEKELAVLKQLEEKKVIKEADAEPLVRVCLRALKDFAIKMEIGGQVWYRYFSVPESEAIALAESRPKKQRLQRLPEELESWLKQRGLSLLQSKAAGRAIELRLGMQSGLGQLDFYGVWCERLSEADVAKAVLAARNLGLPALLLTRSASKRAVRLAAELGAKLVSL